MTHRRRAAIVVALCAAAGAAAAASACSFPDHASTPHVGPELVLVARFEEQPTGVAVSRSGRVFVNFPRWRGEPETPVAEVLADGSTRPYPPDEKARGSLVSVQSVHVDAADRLWILDPANPGLPQSGVVLGEAKLVRVDLATDAVARVYRFDGNTAPEDSYLNDVRVDVAGDIAYLTDSALGALIVLDLRTGAARRVLEGHPSVEAEEGVVPVVGGEPWTAPFGIVPQVKSDGIALSPDGRWLYWHAVTGRTLWRAPARDLRPETVERVATTSCVDGMEMDAAGDLYLTAIEHDAIERVSREGAIHTIVRDPRIQWPDSIAIGPDRTLYVACSQIHLMRLFNWGYSPRTEPYAVYRVALPR